MTKVARREKCSKRDKGKSDEGRLQEQGRAGGEEARCEYWQRNECSPARPFIQGYARVVLKGQLMIWQWLEGSERHFSAVTGQMKRDFIVAHQRKDAFRRLDIREQGIQLTQVSLTNHRITLELGMIGDQEYLA